MQKRRLFVGIQLSSDLRKRLRREVSAWSGLPLIPISDENFHVTLLFLGFIQEEDIESICDTLSEGLEKEKACEMNFNAIQVFPDIEQANDIALVGESNDGLRLLRQAVEQSLGYLVPERKSFRPHVTLAHIRKAAWNALSEKPTVEKSVNFVETVESVTLFESFSDAGKRRYEALMEFPLL